MTSNRALAGWAIVAAGSLVLAYADPWPASGPEVPFVSTKSAARKVFPTMTASSEQPTTVTMARAGEPATSLRMTSEGPVVEVHGERAGPADLDAWDGLVASLRMATTLRAAESGTSASVSGTIEVVFESGRASLRIAGASAEGAGVHATLVEPGGSSSWVVETELAELVDLPVEAWVRARLSGFTAREVAEIRTAAGEALRRGDDGLWRWEGQGIGMIASAVAVEARLDRVLASRLTPWIRARPDAEAWKDAFTITSTSGVVESIRMGGPCRRRPDAVLVDRGPGWVGCVSPDALSPWPADPSALLEPRLVPYALERILRIEHEGRSSVTLRRHQGDWRWLEGDVARAIDGAEVRRWFASLEQLEVSSLERPAPAGDVQTWRFVTDAAVTLTLTCGNAADGPCRRDEGRWWAVEGVDAGLAWTPETFESRRILDLGVEDVTALEIVDQARDGAVRQSAHFDLGVWRLDAPEHPDGNDALNEVALEDILATLASLRAEAWVPRPADGLRRSIGLDLRPRRQRTSHAEIEVFEGCVVGSDGRTARVDAATCGRLERDLLHPDPLAYWLRRGATMEMESQTTGARHRWRQEDGAWAPEGVLEGEPPPLAIWAEIRDARVEPGAPKTPAQWRVQMRPEHGLTFAVEIGADWAALDGADWYYDWGEVVADR